MKGKAKAGGKRKASESSSSGGSGDLGSYPASRRLVASVLIDKAGDQMTRGNASTGPAHVPAVYANLDGRMGLVESDPVWRGLINGTLSIGDTFTTSALVLTNDTAEAFHNGRGMHGNFSRCGVREWNPINPESDVVCFLSEPSNPQVAVEAPAPSGARSPRSPKSPSKSPTKKAKAGAVSAPAATSTCRSMVHVGGNGYHLPPGASVTLVSISDSFRAHKKKVHRRLYTCHVAFDTADPHLAAGDAHLVPQLPPSPMAIAAAEAASRGGASADGGAEKGDGATTG